MGTRSFKTELCHLKALQRLPPDRFQPAYLALGMNSHFKILDFARYHTFLTAKENGAGQTAQLHRVNCYFNFEYDKTNS